MLSPNHFSSSSRCLEIPSIGYLCWQAAVGSWSSVSGCVCLRWGWQYQVVSGCTVGLNLGCLCCRPCQATFPFRKKLRMVRHHEFGACQAHWGLHFVLRPGPSAESHCQAPGKPATIQIEPRGNIDPRQAKTAEHGRRTRSSGAVLSGSECERVWTCESAVRTAQVHVKRPRADTTAAASPTRSSTVADLARDKLLCGKAIALLLDAKKLRQCVIVLYRR